MQLTWSRSVNIQGRVGCNLLEHLNRQVKTILSNLGTNVTHTSVLRAGKSVGTINHVCEVFEQEIGTSDYHHVPHFGKDFEKS